MARKSPIADTADSGASGATRASAVYDLLRSDITHGVLEPGLKLRIGHIGKRYGVGASPLREAMNRLSAEGLVTRTDQRGFNVAGLSWAELPVLTQNRIQLESLAIAESIEHRNQEWEDRLALMVHRLSRTPRSLETEHYVPNQEWETLHREFHKTLLANCQSRWLRGFCESLADEAYRFRQVAALKVFSMRNEHEEHVAIFEAAIRGNVAQSIALLAKHYNKTSAVVASKAATD